MKQKNGVFGVVTEAGANITGKIAEAIAFSANENRAIAFEFNDVIVTVHSDSDPELIYRDYLRAYKGYINEDIGPYPNLVLTDEEKANDARIEAENKRELQELKAKYEAEVKAKGEDIKINPK